MPDDEVVAITYLVRSTVGRAGALHSDKPRFCSLGDHQGGDGRDIKMTDLQDNVQVFAEILPYGVVRRVLSPPGMVGIFEEEEVQ